MVLEKTLESPWTARKSSQSILKEISPGCSLEKKVKVKSLSRVRLFATPWTVAYQAPLSMGFSRQECWSGLPFPSPGDLPDPGSNLGLPQCRQTLYHLSHQKVSLPNSFGSTNTKASLVAETAKRLPAMRETRVPSWVGKIPWRRKWQPTPVFLPRESREWRNLVGYSPCGRKESDTTE